MTVATVGRTGIPLLMVVAIDYHAVRLLCLRAALVDFLRRWGIYLAIAVLLFSAGSNAPFAIAAALAGNLVRPLMIAADHGWWVVPAMLAYVLGGALPVVLTRPLWWPRGWAAAERALPIEATAIRRSDRLFSWIVSAPWQAVLLVGTIGLWIQGAAPRDAQHGWTAATAYAVAAIGPQQLALHWMRHVRRGARPRGSSVRRDRRSNPARAVAVAATGTLRALVLLPLVRGRATRSASALVAGTIATGICATSRLWSDLTTGWSLAVLALVSLVATSALRPCTVRELQPLWRAHRELPFTVQACEAARLLIVLMPALVGTVVGVAVMLSTPGPARLRVLAAYGLVLAVGCGFEASTPETMQPSNHAARWILILSSAIAFGSEVSPS